MVNRRHVNLHGKDEYLTMLQLLGNIVRYCFIATINVQQFITATGPKILSKALLEEWRRL